jgi:hypothetical protein
MRKPSKKIRRNGWRLKQAAYRDRKRRGVAVVSVEVEPGFVARLLQTSRLTEAASRDRSALRGEIAALVSWWAREGFERAR